ncbi:MAG: polysaccharide lyase 6 family protein [Paludibacter sp.]|jgi:poly(beta-D-mannuronate) lyase|nr:polysaccharide lyase 6 family protein [Paludibacter sp.]
MRYILVPLLFLLSVIQPVLARRVVVATASAVNSGSWSAGDTIVLKNGTWTNQSVSLRAFGTESQPIVIMAETPGEVIFNGSSRVAISGRYVEVNGIYFKDGTLSGSAVVDFRTSSSNLAENCRLTNCAIVNYNPALNTVDSKWVSLYGKNNRVDNCSFENKTNSGTLLVVWLTTGIVPEHIIENNYFGYRNANLDSNGSELNGQEIIRIGDSNTSMQYANCLVRNNFFDKCNGEIEIISNKSCGNIYSNNVFYECKGMLTLRHGNDCTVAGNYFIGNGVSNSGGVRIIGEDHKVYNNYFENLRGTNFRAGLCIVRGKLNSVLNDYFQVKNAVVVFNTFVNCNQSFCINYNSSSTYTMPPIGTIVAHNQVYNTSSSNTNVVLAQQSAEMDVTWKNNLMNMGRYTSITLNAQEVVTGQNPLMQQVETLIPIMEPQSGSALTNYTTNEHAMVSVDIRGRERSASAKLPGASEINGTINLVMPSKTTVGADFFNKTTAVKPQYSDLKPLRVKGVHGMLSFESKLDGQVTIHSVAGSMIKSFSIVANDTLEKQMDRGLYLVSFHSAVGDNYTQKIIL